MSIETDYTPKYVSLSDVPISGPDEYTSEQKRKAIFSAESRLELDTNDGEEIEDRNLLGGHQTAVMNLATHVLTHAAEEPSDVTIGDMASGGGTITDYSSRYLEEYQMLVDQLQSATSGSTSNFSVSVNTGSDRAEGAEEQL